MPDFNQLLYIAGVAWNFNFTKVLTPPGEKYFVKVLVQQSVITSFEMKDKDSGNWTIVQPAPHWVISLQNKLDAIIKKHEQTKSTFS